MNPTGYHSAPTPPLTTSPAMPRNDAADRYSPDTAAALKAGEMRREATRKSDVVRIAATPRAPMSSVASTTGTTASAITGRPSLRLGPLRAAQLPPGQRRSSTGHGSTATASQETGTSSSRTSSSAGTRCSSSGRPTRKAPPASRAVTARRSCTARIRSARASSSGVEPGRAGGRTAPAAERDAGLRAGHRDPRAAASPPAPARHRQPYRFIGRPAGPPESNSPRVAASSSRSRSSRACRRLTGTSPTSVCASSPPLTSLRSSCTACTASR